ncbi:MAG: branched-chain amino acid ABC transporter substrate-binding protein [Candidatus Promineifilaceae bacterium]|jgi:branched-chain amino acid transport system substrate-binding protein
MKRFLPLVILLLIVSLMLVACGGDEEEPAVEPPTEEAGAPAQEEATAEPTEEMAAEPTEEMAEELTCDDAIGCVEIAPGDPILLASALVISGPDGALGQDSQRGIEIAMEYRGDVLGHPVELQPEDDGCGPEGGQASAQKIVSNPQIVAVIGTSCSGAAVPAAQIISDNGYVMVSPSNTAVALTNPDLSWRPGYLRTAHNDSVQGGAMADFVYNELGLTKAAAIHDGDPYTEGLATVFANDFQAMGGEIVAFEAEDRNATNVEPLLTTIAAAGPEFLYFPTFTNLSALITKTARDIEGLEDVVVLASADGALSADFLEAAGDAAEGMYHSGPDLTFENELYDTFLATYAEEYGEEPPAVFHAHAFDATNMILNAIEQVAQQGDDGTLLIGRQALRDALYATAGYEGITGTLTCDEYGDCADAKINVNQVQNGEFVRIWP